MKTNELLSKATLFGDTKARLASALGISTTALANKLRGDSEFKASEIKTISDMYELTDDEVRSIFF